jgi:ribosomal protein S18 acetylase RimI-like enzyme
LAPLNGIREVLNGGEVLVGTAEISFDRATHSARLTLAPPANAGYVTNMAVAPAYRRRGVGRALLAALEQVSG